MYQRKTNFKERQYKNMELGGFYKTITNKVSFKYLLQIFKYVTLVIEVM